MAPPLIDLHAIAAAKALATPLPPELVRPSGHSRRNQQYYAKVQAEYYAKVEAECYANLVAEQQEQIAPLPPPEPSQELPPPPRTEPSQNQQFVSLIETKLAALKDPAYAEQFSRPHYNEQFIGLIESRLAELKEPAYAEQFAIPPYNEQFIAQLESKLGVYQALKAEEQILKAEELLLKAQQDYAAGVRMIKDFFGSQQIALPQFLSEQSIAPLCEIPLLGYSNQPTVNFHCGIANSFSSVIEGGVCLSSSLDRNFAVQPHLIHTDSLVEGVALVATEKVNVCAPYIDPVLQVLISGVFNESGLNLAKLSEMALDNSQIQKSIQYELANLSSTAQNIIKIGNPNLKQVHVTFSNGGYVFKEALKQLSPEYRETIVVITVGTTAIIEGDLACKVFNIIGDKDHASKICNGWFEGIEKAKAYSSVEVIEQREVLPRVNGHYFMQDEYQKEIAETISTEIVGKYEIY